MSLKKNDDARREAGCRGVDFHVEVRGVRIETWTGFTSQCQDSFDIRLGFERQAIF